VLIFEIGTICLNSSGKVAIYFEVLSGGAAERNHDKTVKIVIIQSVFKLGASRLRSGSANNYDDRFCYTRVHLVKKMLIL